jgi:hypothetical protein
MDTAVERQTTRRGLGFASLIVGIIAIVAYLGSAAFVYGAAALAQLYPRSDAANNVGLAWLMGIPFLMAIILGPIANLVGGLMAILALRSKQTMAGRRFATIGVILNAFGLLACCVIGSWGTLHP